MTQVKHRCIKRYMRVEWRGRIIFNFLKPQLMCSARARALWHLLYNFNSKHRIWRLYSHFGYQTYRVFCECGEEFE